MPLVAAAGRSLTYDPAVTSVSPDAETVLSELEGSNRLLVQQVFKPIGNEYRISVPAPGSAEEGRPLLFVKQKKMKIKEDIRFRVSPDDPEHLFMIKSKSVFEFRGRHEVLDADGQVIGLLEKAFAKSLILEGRVSFVEGLQIKLDNAAQKGLLYYSLATHF